MIMEKLREHEMECTSNIQRFNQWLRNSILVKIGTICILILLLLIPAKMISTVIFERAQLQDNAKNEVSSKWGKSQTITGPILTIPFKKCDYDTSGKVIRTSIEYAHLLPESLSIDGTMTPQIRNRGIYKAILYTTQLAIQGRISSVDIEELHIPQENILFDQAYMSIGISDMRGIKDKISITWDDNSYIAEPGAGATDILTSGIHVPLKSIARDYSGNMHTFSTNINLNGSEQLQFIPLGKETNVTLSSSWSTPSFNGEFLPYERESGADGFKAKWKILQLNRDFPQAWIANAYTFANSAFGVNLIMPVDEYQKITRTSKYALLFIALTFCAFFFIEIMNRKHLHAIQYLLIGFALCLFYSLLLSLSECIGFGYAYLIASVAITGLIAGYTSAVFQSMRVSVVIASVVAVLYAFLYVILQQEDYALLMGSIGLFLILGVIMFLTRKIDWYLVNVNKDNA
jgi:inner membrane protein